MILFGFIDGVFFTLLMLVLLAIFVLYRLGCAAVSNPVKAVGWAKVLHAMLHGLGGER